MHGVGYFLIGALAGLNSSCWGAYKDTPYECFSIIRFMRSIIIGGCISLLIYFLLISRGVGFPHVMLFATVVGIERMVTEFRKAFFMQEDQAKYAIPQQFCLLGKPVTSFLLRYLVGLALVLVVSIVSIVYYHISEHIENGLGYAVIGGALAGVFTAVGGAWKDAPFEQFKWLGFMRSPVVSVVSAMILYLSASEGVAFMFISCLGAERMLTEFYKTFIKGGGSSKFKNSIRHHNWVKKRTVFIFPYIMSWALFMYFLIIK